MLVCLAVCGLSCREPAEPPSVNASGEEDITSCSRDSDCTLSSSCLGCNRCYRIDPAAQLGLDCEALCFVREELRCVCDAGQCRVDP